ncbi:hypothetical protein LWI28_025222 [Acer negundo]|uniref:hAT-like transposase RNase-H fold domain-containing protein n=1 Tax=Acer negundo TaxID=4023 RepID=A0AAD5J7X2_ACENE|nr:hypothetical protein LWI28_025222 [Acer negundo]
MMLEVALIYKDVFIRLQQRDSQYKNLPSESEWELAKVMCEHLKPFYKLTNLFPGAKYPTTNLFFPMICEIKLSLKSWLDSEVEVIRLMATNMTPKFEKYWDKIHRVIAVAVVLDPRYKMDLIDYFFPKMYGIDCELETQRIFELCNDLVSEYQTKEEGGLGEDIGESGVGSSFTSSSSSFSMWDVKGFESYKRKYGRQRKLTSKLESYLEQEEISGSKEFDILL